MVDHRFIFWQCLYFFFMVFNTQLEELEIFIWHLHEWQSVLWFFHSFPFAVRWEELLMPKVAVRWEWHKFDNRSANRTWYITVLCTNNILTSFIWYCYMPIYSKVWKRLCPIYWGFVYWDGTKRERDVTKIARFVYVSACRHSLSAPWLMCDLLRLWSINTGSLRRKTAEATPTAYKNLTKIWSNRRRFSTPIHVLYIDVGELCERQFVQQSKPR